MSDALAIKVEQPPAPAGDGAVVLGMIDRLLARPDVPVEKLEQLFALHQKVEADKARRAFCAALADLQADLPTVVAIGKITGEDKDTKQKITRSRYARWEDVNEAIRPHLTKHGFALSFRITQPQPDRVQVTAVLSHREGHSEETSLHLPNDPSGGKNNVQAWGSSVSYGKRYTAFALLNIASRGEDDDGVKAGEAPSEHATLADINKLIEETQSNRVWFLERYSVETMEDLTGKQRDEIKTLLQAKQAKMKKGARNG